MPAVSQALLVKIDLNEYDQSDGLKPFELDPSRLSCCLQFQCKEGQQAATRTLRGVGESCGTWHAGLAFEGNGTEQDEGRCQAQGVTLLYLC